MKDAAIFNAVREAKRFLKTADAYHKRRSLGDTFDWQGTKESAAMRRASLDLTRALAEMRKP